MNTRVPMTPRGEKALREVLDETNKKMVEVADKIAHARGFGDLSENAEYTAAKEEQALLMKLSQSVVTKLRNSHIIDPQKLPKTGKVVFGATVHLHDISKKETMIIQIVGEDESDVKTGKISVSSPIARGTIGKMQGEMVQINTLDGIKSFEIKSVDYI